MRLAVSSFSCSRTKAFTMPTHRIFSIETYAILYTLLIIIIVSPNNRDGGRLGRRPLRKGMRRSRRRCKRNEKINLESQFCSTFM